MRPPQQRLHPGDAARAQCELRLIHHVELAIVDGVAQLSQLAHLGSATSGTFRCGVGEQLDRVGLGHRHVRPEGLHAL